MELLHAFHWAGDEIEAYVKKDKCEDPLPIISEVTRMLQQAGLQVNSQDFLLKFFTRNRNGYIYNLDRMTLFTQKIVDTDKPGYPLSTRPEPGHYKFKVPSKSAEKKSSIPFWFTSSFDAKGNTASCHNGMEAKVERSGYNSLSILSSKAWAMFGVVLKRIVRRGLHSFHLRGYVLIRLTFLAYVTF